MVASRSTFESGVNRRDSSDPSHHQTYALGERHGDVVVQYADLDLNSAAGNKVLYARLSAAAERACGNEPSARELKRQVQYRACYDKALNRAVDKIGSRELQALHTSKATGNVG